MMDKTIITFLIYLLVSVPMIFADDNESNGESNNDEQEIIDIVRKDQPTTKPHMPGIKADIECYYCNGYIHIMFEEPEGNGELKITDIFTNEYSTHSFTTSSPQCIYIGDISQSVMIEITTTEGNSYVGYLFR